MHVLTTGLIAALFGLMSAGQGKAQAPNLKAPAAEWGEVRSLGKMWEWHRLLDISADGNKLLIGGRSSFVAIYDLTAGKVVQEFRTRESVQDACFSPDGKLLAVAEWRDGLKLRDAATLQVVETLRGSGGLSSAQVRFSPDSTRLICYSWWGADKQYWSYDLATKKEIGWPAGKNADTPTTMMREGLRGWGHHLFSVERLYEPDKGIYKGHKVWVTDSRTGKVSDQIELGKIDYFQFDLSPDGTTAIVMQPGDSPRVVDLRSGMTVRELPGHARWVTCAAYSPDGKLIVTASGMWEDGHARVYTTKYSPAFAPSEIIIRDAGTGNVLARLDGKHDYSNIGFSPNGKYIYVSTRDNELLLWGKLPAIPTDAAPLPNYDRRLPAKPAAIGVVAAAADRFDKLVKELAVDDRTRDQKVEALFLAVLGRLPTQPERRLALASQQNAADEQAWLGQVLATLLATSEFRTHVADLQRRVKQ